MKKSFPKPKEHEIQTQIIHYLQMKGYYVQRMNSGAIRTERGGLVRMNPAGTPDIMAFKPLMVEKEKIIGLCKLLFIEVKRPQNSPTRLQELKMEELSSFGAKCFVAHSLDEVIEGLK